MAEIDDLRLKVVRLEKQLDQLKQLISHLQFKPRSWTSLDDFIKRASGMDHGKLTGLGDNDHHQYLTTWVNQVILTSDNTNPSTHRTWETWAAY